MRKWRLLAVLLTVSLVAANPMPDEFSFSFRSGVENHPIFVFTGPGARQACKTDPRGLRIRLSPDRKSTNPVGVGPSFTIRGDFQATLGFEFLSTQEPLPSDGAGIRFGVKLETQDSRGIAVTRLR